MYDWVKKHLGIFAISSVGLIANLIWIAQYRVGRNYTIDEAGYLERALVDGHFFSQSGLGGLYHHLQNGDPQAPLLPVLAGVLHSFFGGPTSWLIGYNEIFYVVLVASVYALVLKLRNRPTALLAAMTIAVVPGVLQVSRTFLFGIAAAAMMTLALTMQVYADKFERWSTTLAWGVALGLASLSRTMVVGLMPGLLFAAAVTVLANPKSKMQIVRVGTALVVAFGIAWIWWGASWRAVFHYLRDYGYGRHAGAYGKSSTVFSVQWWTARPAHIYNNLGPLLTLVLFGVVITSIAIGVRGQRGERFTGRKLAGWLAENWRRLVQSRWMPVVVALVWDYFALSSTRNQGSYFEIVAVPLVVSLVFVTAKIPLRPSKIAMSAATFFAALLLLASSISWFALHPYGSISALSSPPLFDGRGFLESYAQNYYRSFDKAKSLKATNELFNRQAQSVNDIAREILAISSKDYQAPFLTVAAEEPFVNTNTIQLRVLQLTGKEMPVMLMKMPRELGASFNEQLTSPIFGQPNFVLLGPNTVLSGDKSFITLDHPMKLVPLLQQLGFKPVFSEKLLAGQTYYLWWKHP
jgi:Dolichyl-phosphate-mannose-protein mannosyltransferase